jgi:hypothetical protein
MMRIHSRVCLPESVQRHTGVACSACKDRELCKSWIRRRLWEKKEERWWNEWRNRKRKAQSFDLFDISNWHLFLVRNQRNYAEKLKWSKKTDSDTGTYYNPPVLIQQVPNFKREPSHCLCRQFDRGSDVNFLHSFHSTSLYTPRLHEERTLQFVHGNQMHVFVRLFMRTSSKNSSFPDSLSKQNTN